MKRRDLFKAVAALSFVALGVKAMPTLNEAITSGYAQVITPVSNPSTVSLTHTNVYYYKWTLDASRGGYNFHA